MQKHRVYVNLPLRLLSKYRNGIWDTPGHTWCPWTRFWSARARWSADTGYWPLKSWKCWRPRHQTPPRPRYSSWSTPTLTDASHSDTSSDFGKQLQGSAGCLRLTSEYSSRAEYTSHNVSTKNKPRYETITVNTAMNSSGEYDLKIPATSTSS